MLIRRWPVSFLGMHLMMSSNLRITRTCHYIQSRNQKKQTERKRRISHRRTYHQSVSLALFWEYVYNQKTRMKSWSASTLSYSLVTLCFFSDDWENSQKFASLPRPPKRELSRAKSSSCTECLSCSRLKPRPQISIPDISSWNVDFFLLQSSSSNALAHNCHQTHSLLTQSMSIIQWLPKKTTNKKKKKNC